MSEWIRVEDRLPEKDQECIVYSSEIGVMVETFEDRHAANNWLVDIQAWCGRCEEYEVTHWMPLPEPPKN